MKILNNQLTFISIEFVLRAYIRHKISPIPPKYSYQDEKGINPAFQTIEEVKSPLFMNEKRIFALRDDLLLATGVKNAYQEHGYEGLKRAIDSQNHCFINWTDRYGHPSLALIDDSSNGKVFYAGFICQRQGYLEIFLSTGRYNRVDRVDEGIQPLTDEQTTILESYLALKFTQAYGNQPVYFYETSPGIQDDQDSALFFTDTPFPQSKVPRIYKKIDILKASELASEAMHYENTKIYIRNYIEPVNPKYQYNNEGNINPAFQNIEQVRFPLRLLEKRIWVLRSDFTMALGVKNAYQKEYGYQGLKENFSECSFPFINWEDRYGHPSLTLTENNYDGSVYYAGYLCQRKGFLQVYLVSGRFERFDLNPKQTQILEAYIASLLQSAFGLQDIVFDVGNSDDPAYHQIFFGHGLFEKTNPQRKYSSSDVDNILQSITLETMQENIGQNQWVVKQSL
ncbi:hypothetical protein A8135_04030 [Legionella jamestowniensis]|uniref:Uncharacterized protein n=1 Tax=Legionella jamestowniensis TaxID=455 RepID=A0ABX2XQE2_9GAMM|nr:hypothetical protein [Legionella jamestowniensis]OCH96818.1 hypothetical protein A8135_04030 [Legionella jamestowniensis]